MKDQFVPFELAVKLKELGFDEECFASIDNFSKTPYIPSKGGLYKNSDGYTIACPLWQQAFDWLLPKLPDYNLDQMENTFDLRYYDGKEWSYIIMMGTRQACLKKLIKIIENGEHE